jgi:hypothetical protein
MPLSMARLDLFSIRPHQALFATHACGVKIALLWIVRGGKMLVLVRGRHGALTLGSHWVLERYVASIL